MELTPPRALLYNILDNSMHKVWDNSMHKVVSSAAPRAPHLETQPKPQSNDKLPFIQPCNLSIINYTFTEQHGKTYIRCRRSISRANPEVSFAPMSKHVWSNSNCFRPSFSNSSWCTGRPRRSRISQPRIGSSKTRTLRFSLVAKSPAASGGAKILDLGGKTKIYSEKC